MLSTIELLCYHQEFLVLSLPLFTSPVWPLTRWICIFNIITSSRDQQMAALKTSLACKTCEKTTAQSLWQPSQHKVCHPTQLQGHTCAWKWHSITLATRVNITHQTSITRSPQWGVEYCGTGIISHGQETNELAFASSLQNSPAVPVSGSILAATCISCTHIHNENGYFNHNYLNHRIQY